MKITSAILTIATSIAAIANAASISDATASSGTYDYVIVGGGVAGLTLANRLSENKDVSVAVLEAGPSAEDLFATYAPGMYGRSVGTALAPMIFTVPQPKMNNRSLFHVTAKLLGGGSAINGLVWTRGDLKDYDAWEELGNPGWNGASMFEYMKKVENFTAPTPEQINYGATYDPKSHGTKGPVDIGFTNFEFPESAKWNASLAALNFTRRDDLLSGSLHGYSTTPNTLNPETVRRSDAYVSYIVPYLGRTNLHVLANHTVSRVTFDGETKGLFKANGVEWYPTGNKANKQTITARREVILSSGSIGSPKLLELSGIGAKHIVNGAGIKSLIDLPGVGSNMQDHVHAITVTATNISGYTTNSVFVNTTLANIMTEEYEKEKTGIWTTVPNNLGYPSPNQLLEGSALVSGKEMATKIRKSASEMAKYYAKTNSTTVALAKKQYAIVAKRYQENSLSPIEINYTPGYVGLNQVDLTKNKYQTVNQVLIAPLSRGYTHINTSDVEDNSIIDPQYYTHPLDIEVHVASTKLARKMLAVEGGLKDINIGETEPGTNATSDEDIKNWLSNNVRSDWHPVGTCAMVPRKLNGVVDSKLKVYGTSNLRVVDASIIPLEVSSHLMQPTYGVAEKAADIIKADYKSEN